MKAKWTEQEVTAAIERYCSNYMKLLNCLPDWDTNVKNFIEFRTQLPKDEKSFNSFLWNELNGFEALKFLYQLNRHRKYLRATPSIHTLMAYVDRPDLVPTGIREELYTWVKLIQAIN